VYVLLAKDQPGRHEEPTRDHAFAAWTPAEVGSTETPELILGKQDVHRRDDEQREERPDAHASDQTTPIEYARRARAGDEREPEVTGHGATVVIRSVGPLAAAASRLDLAHAKELLLVANSTIRIPFFDTGDQRHEPYLRIDVERRRPAFGQLEVQPGRTRELQEREIIARTSRGDRADENTNGSRNELNCAASTKKIKSSARPSPARTCRSWRSWRDSPCSRRGSPAQNRRCRVFQKP